MIRRTIREWECIGYGSEEDKIPEAQADRLAAVAQTSVFSDRGGQGVLEHRRKALRARGIVGIIATHDCQLEILPKIEGSGEKYVSNETLRTRLVHMLAVTHDLPVDARTKTQMGWQRDTVLEPLIRLFCTGLAEAVRQGMPRRYLAHADDLPVLRGRMNVTRQFSTLAVSPQKLACRFDALSPDIAINQVMRAAIIKLSRLTQAPDNQRKLRELSFIYADVTDVSANALRWDRIVLDRTNQRWRGLLSFARLFLSGRHQHTSTGPIDGYALLFEMNVLFEQYVARLLSRALAGTRWRVSAQGGGRCCLYEGEEGRFQTRPDIVVRQGNRIAMIIDTKWKRIAPRIDDPKHGVSQADIYQLLAYQRLYKCRDVMLLYPHHGGLGPQEIHSRYSVAEQDANETLHVATLSLAGTRRDHTHALKKLVGGCIERASTNRAPDPDQSRLEPSALVSSHLP